MTTSAAHQRRGLATLMWLALPLVVGGGAGWWYVRHELPYVNRSNFVSPLALESLTVRHDAKGSGHFGAPRSGSRHHTGVDLLARVGDPVFAIRSGRVMASRYHRGFGYFIEIDHGRGFSSLYAHLSRLDVRRGMRVRQGQLIGAVGKSGNARSRHVEAHLHFELQRKGQPIDPRSVSFFHARIHDPVYDTPASQNLTASATH